MNELAMMEAALFQLRSALSDDPIEMPIRLGADVLANALATAKAEGMNAARASDIDFALNDLVAAVNDAGAPEGVYAPLAMLQRDAETLRASTELPAALVDAIHALVSKLKTRKAAIERSQYRAEGTAETPPPHPPQELRGDAIPIARQLAEAGFVTPVLDVLIADPDSMRYHHVTEIIDELEVIAG